MLSGSARESWTQQSQFGSFCSDLCAQVVGVNEHEETEGSSLSRSGEMGNCPFSVCIQQVWEKQTVQVVLPDGQVLFMPHPLTAAMLMKTHPHHFVCQGSPSFLEQRLPLHTRLESDQIYYLLPKPNSDFTPTSFAARLHPASGSHPTRHALPPEKYAPPSKSPSLVFHKPTSPRTSSTFSRLNLRPQQCLINLFLFRKSVASIMPEESFKTFPAPPPPSPPPHSPLWLPNTGGASPGAVSAAASVASIGPNMWYPPHSPNHPQLQQLQLQQQHQQLQQQPRRVDSQRHRGGGGGTRGRKHHHHHHPVWRPQLESISETRPWHDFTTKNYLNDFSVASISTVKALATIPPDFVLSSPEHHRLVAAFAAGGAADDSLLHGDRDPHRQRVAIYSA